jgi:RND family efflux transporter MFP subunit
VLGVAGGVLAIAAVAIALRGRRRRREPPAAVVLVLALGFSAIARGHGGEDHAEPPTAPAPTGLPESAPAGAVYLAKESQFLLGVRTAVVGEREVEARVQAIGRVIPRIDGHAAIAAPVAGRIAAPPGGKLPFIGDRVRRGQVLFVVEQTLAAAEAGDLRARALAARSEVAQARARREQARRELERRRSLTGVVADKDIQAAAVELELAEHQLGLAEQAVRLFGGAQLTRLGVTAPIDGTIAAADVSLGEQVTTEQNLYTIVDPGTLWVEAEVFEADVPRLPASGRADVRVDGTDTVFVGQLYRIGQLVDPATRTVKVVLSVDNASGQLRPGMFARLAVATGAPVRRLVVPDAAVIEEGGRRFAFVKLGPEVFVRREIVLGERDGEVWALGGGITRGERVVVQGTYQLRTAR